MGVWHRRAGTQLEPAQHRGRISREPICRQAPKIPRQIETGAQAGESPQLGGEQSCSTRIPRRASLLHPHLPAGTGTATCHGGTGPLLYPAATEHVVFVPMFLHLSLSYLGVFPVQCQEERSLVQSRKQHLPHAASPIRAGPVLLFFSPTAPFSLVTLFCYYSAHSFLLCGCGPLLLEGCHLHFLKLFSTAPFFSACFSKGN